MYAGIVSRVTNFRDIPNADRIRLASVTVLGVQLADVIISKDTSENTLGIYFGPDCQLSVEFCEANKLLKKDGGYLDNEKRRITAQRFKGCKSEGLWLNLSALDYIDDKRTRDLKEGSKVEYWQRSDGDNFPICKRYPKPEVRSSTIVKKDTRTWLQKQLDKLVPPFYINFPEHYDTPQLTNEVQELTTIPEGARITITSKYHGTSHRVGHVETSANLPWYKHVINRLTDWMVGTPIYPAIKYGYVHGSRRVILDDLKPGYYGSNHFRYDAIGTPILDRNEMLFGEIVGYVESGKPIMPKHSTEPIKELKKRYGTHITYDYGCDDGSCVFYVYRIARWTGLAWVDLPFEDVQNRARVLGFKTPEILYTGIYDGNPQSIIDLAKSFCESEAGIYTPEFNHIREGVVVRLDWNGKHKAYKYKSYGFKVLEGIVPDVNEDTLEQKNDA